MRRLFKELTNADFTLKEIRNVIEKKKMEKFLYRKQKSLSEGKLPDVKKEIEHLESYLIASDKPKAANVFKKVRTKNDFMKAYNTLYKSLDKEQQGYINERA